MVLTHAAGSGFRSEHLPEHGSPTRTHDSGLAEVGRTQPGLRRGRGGLSPLALFLSESLAHGKKK